ncbi:MAG TPA: hypothetical protein VIM16_09640 [Mucilaginibacter sp.]|jgi:hypothetical protein
MNVLFKKLLLLTIANILFLFSFSQGIGGTASLTVEDESNMDKVYHFPDAFPVVYAGTQSSDAHGCQVSYTNGFDNNGVNIFVQSGICWWLC